jgi:DNA-binding NarL/FixJ family response regulator
VIRVVIADDHPVFRRGLSGVLAEAPDVEVVGEAEEGSSAVSVAVDQEADVVLMDLNMEGVGGVEATAALLEQRPATGVLVLTMSEDDSTVHAALRAGARGYLVKGASGDAILAAVRAVAVGSSVLGPSVAGGLLARATAAPPTHRSGPFPQLTDREEEVLDLIARGLSNGEIARHLVVSDKTVRNHVSNVFAKLGVPDRSRAIVLAREKGLGTSDAP